MSTKSISTLLSIFQGRSANILIIFRRCCRLEVTWDLIQQKQQEEEEMAALKELEALQQINEEAEEEDDDEQEESDSNDDHGKDKENEVDAEDNKSVTTTMARTKKMKATPKKSRLENDGIGRF